MRERATKPRAIHPPSSPVNGLHAWYALLLLTLAGASLT
jgi:hypothetical protein